MLQSPVRGHLDRQRLPLVSFVVLQKYAVDFLGKVFVYGSRSGKSTLDNNLHHEYRLMHTTCSLQCATNAANVPNAYSH